MKEKIIDIKELSIKVGQLKAEGKKVTLCHGCFDVLHFGHLRHFIEAKNSSDFLVVTITPDKYVNKGEDRPIFNQDFRAELLSGLAVIDYIAINNWKSAVETLTLIKPTFIAKGSEYETVGQTVNPLFEIEKTALETFGGKMLFTYEETSSSSAIVEKIKKL